MTNMTRPIPLEEMLADLENTERDIQCLATIVGNLDLFIHQAGGEERLAFRTDRLKYSALLNQATGLKAKIKSCITGSHV